MANDKVPLEITEAAGEWLECLSSDAVPEDQREAFADWLLTSPVHVGEYLRISTLRAELSGTLQRHPEWVEELLQHDADNIVELTDRSISKTAVDLSVRGSVSDSVPVEESVSTHSSVRSRLWATAATVAVISIASWFGVTSYLDTPSDPPTIATALGEQRSILLSDGSTLELNTETEVRIRFTEHARDIDLLRGELLVDVAKDPDRAFRVLSDGVVAQAIGTRFNVYKREGDTVVTVIEGRVAVNQAPTAFPSGTSNSGSVATSEPVELTAGLQIAVANQAVATPSVELTPEPVSLAKTTAWTDRRLMFDDEPLSAIVAEFNRYNRARLIITDAQLNDKRLSGVFDANDPNEFIALLQSLERIDIQQSADGHRTLLRVETTNSEQDISF